MCGQFAHCLPFVEVQSLSLNLTRLAWWPCGLCCRTRHCLTKIFCWRKKSGASSCSFTNLSQESAHILPAACYWLLAACFLMLVACFDACCLLCCSLQNVAALLAVSQSLTRIAGTALHASALRRFRALCCLLFAFAFDLTDLFWHRALACALLAARCSGVIPAPDACEITIRSVGARSSRLFCIMLCVLFCISYCARSHAHSLFTRGAWATGFHPLQT